jgi:hypothetical protein
MDIEKISNILGYNDLKMNNYLTNKLKCLYPDIDLNNIDNDLLENIIQNIVTNDYKNIDKIKNEMFTNIQNITNVSNNIDEKINTNNYKNEFDMEIIKQNILMADEIIPEMSISSNLIYLKGKLNGIDTKIMIDTGASSCVIFKSVVDKCNLEYLIDTSTSVMVEGAHGIKPTLGTIWFVELELEICKNNRVNIPISLEVIDDTETINANKIIKEHSDKITKIVNINDDNENKDIISNQKRRFEIILGMTFLKSYRANIDFSTMTITLNKNIKIKFN